MTADATVRPARGDDSTAVRGMSDVTDADPRADAGRLGEGGLMPRRSPPLSSVTLALALALAVGALAGCRGVEVRAPVPGRADDMGRTVSPLAPDHGWIFALEAGSIAGALTGPSERLASGLRLAIRADSGLAGSATAHALEEYRPSPIPIGTVRWVTGAAGPDGGVSGDVLIEWMIGVRERGSCAVEVELVPRLTPSCGDPVFLENLRIRRTLAVGDALILSTDPAAPSGSVAGLLVGAPRGGPGRLALRVRS